MVPGVDGPLHVTVFGAAPPEQGVFEFQTQERREPHRGAHPVCPLSPVLATGYGGVQLSMSTPAGRAHRGQPGAEPRAAGAPDQAQGGRSSRRRRQGTEAAAGAGPGGLREERPELRSGVVAPRPIEAATRPGLPLRHRTDGLGRASGVGVRGVELEGPGAPEGVKGVR